MFLHYLVYTLHLYLKTQIQNEWTITFTFLVMVKEPKVCDVCIG